MVFPLMIMTKDLQSLIEELEKENCVITQIDKKDLSQLLEAAKSIVPLVTALEVIKEQLSFGDESGMHKEAAYHEAEQALQNSPYKV